MMSQIIQRITYTASCATEKTLANNPSILTQTTFEIGVIRRSPKLLQTKTLLRNFYVGS